MKLFTVMWLMAVSIWADAQVPSFKSFNPPQFSTNNFTISLQSPLTVTNVTVVSNLISQTIITTNIYTTNLFATNIFNNNLYTTNVFATNLYVTNIFQDITFHGKTTFNTNVTFVVGPTNTVVADRLSNTDQLLTSGFIYTNYFYTNLPSGTNDLYTSSSNYFSIIVGSIATTNTAGTTWTSLVKIASTYYSPSSTGTATTNSPSASVGLTQNYTPTDEEVLSLVTGSAGANVTLTVTMVPKTSSFISSKLLSLSAGPNLIFTVPSGQLRFSQNNTVTYALSQMQVVYFNHSGAQRTVAIHIVPNGGSVDDSTIFRQGPVASGGASSTIVPPLFLPGTSVYLTSDATTAIQWAFSNGSPVTP